VLVRAGVQILAAGWAQVVPQERVLAVVRLREGAAALVLAVVTLRAAAWVRVLAVAQILGAMRVRARDAVETQRARAVVLVQVLVQAAAWVRAVGQLRSGVTGRVAAVAP